jgi:hypothetical protein
VSLVPWRTLSNINVYWKFRECGIEAESCLAFKDFVFTGEEINGTLTACFSFHTNSLYYVCSGAKFKSTLHFLSCLFYEMYLTEIRGVKNLTQQGSSILLMQFCNLIL